MGMITEFQCPACGETFFKTTGYTRAQYEKLRESGQPIPKQDDKAPFKCPSCGSMVDPSDSSCRPTKRMRIMID